MNIKAAPAIAILLICSACAGGKDSPGNPAGYSGKDSDGDPACSQPLLDENNAIANFDVQFEQDYKTLQSDLADSSTDAASKQQKAENFKSEIEQEIQLINRIQNDFGNVKCSALNEKTNSKEIFDVSASASNELNSMNAIEKVINDYLNAVSHPGNSQTDPSGVSPEAPTAKPVYYSNNRA